MSEAKIYSSIEAEKKWYAYWNEKGFFNSKPSHKEPYTIVIPPPNVTGVLHMGHMLNNTIQDILIRRARMQGKEACWVPGTDHASIATEAKVVALLKEKGIEKKDLSRQEFLDHAMVWKEKYGGIILEQLKKLGASCDWNRTRFTMEADMSEAVIDVFVDLFEKGKIYRGMRIVNWDPQGKTALSDEEVNYKEVQSKLYYVKYAFVSDPNQFITIATTRPETILGDTAICVHPEDVRYQSWIGQKVKVPFTDRTIAIIGDTYVDPEFGTGCLKVTPAHDTNDYQLGLKHQLEVIDVLHPDGTLNENGGAYAGLDRFIARKKIAKDLDELGLLIEVKDIVNKVGHSERTNAVIEPRISMQWYCDMKSMAEPALKAVLNEDIKLYPPRFVNLYKVWMENVQDWCISRQLWWGQQIPAWYLFKGSSDFVVAKTKAEAQEKFRSKGFHDQLDQIIQDEDVLDTWFSSWLWPISVFDGFKNPDNEDFKYYYPTSDLVTAPEILFFWVARMIMAGIEFKGQIPFKNVYLHGIVRDKQGKKMSKSLGNSPDPLVLIDQYGADGVRVGMLLSAPAGNDLLFDEKLCEQGRNFSNKIWNAYKLISGWEVVDVPMPKVNLSAIAWFKAKFQLALHESEDHYTKYRMSDALMCIYKLVWDDFCATYLELIKPVYGQPIDKGTLETSIVLFEEVLKVMHPFTPFVSETIWHELRERSELDYLTIHPYPVLQPFDQNWIDFGNLALEAVSQIRNIRNSKQISPKQSIVLCVNAQKSLIDTAQFKAEAFPIIEKLGLVEKTEQVDKVPEASVGFLIKGIEFYVPIGDMVDPVKEKENMEKELSYYIGFLKSIEAKLSNEKFKANAKPEVIDNEMKKKADAEAKIASLQTSLGLV